MRTLRCKCGEGIAWTTDNFQDCQGCEKCQTTYADHQDGHRPLQPHIWKIVYNPNTGKPYKRCEKCYNVDEKSYKKSCQESNKKNMKTGETKLSEVIDYIRGAKVGDIIARRNLMDFSNGSSTVDNYRNYLTHAGYLRIKSRGLYVYIKEIPWNLTYTQLVKQGYPNSDWTKNR